MPTASPRVLISGGGTGGHIFPAIAIADEVKKRYPTANILFVGAKDRMEMEKVPEAGYPIQGLWISGIQRSLSAKNVMFPIKLIHSLWKARKIVKHLKPHIAVGVGGYASAAVLRMSTAMDIPSVIQEQNAYPGITNKWLADKVNLICVAFEGLERFFPKEKIRITGNPVRNNMVAIEGKREKALEFFGLRPDMPVLLVTGGSLGARSINQAIFESLEHIVEQGVQVIWQTGKLFIEVANDHFGNHALVSVHPFIQKMDLAYAASDLIVARAGAITVSEIELVNKPAILIPLPSAAEDHQTQNALKLVEKKAAVLIPDSQAKERLGKEVIRLMKTPELREELISNLKSMGHSNATERIVDEMEKLWQLK